MGLFFEAAPRSSRATVERAVEQALLTEPPAEGAAGQIATTLLNTNYAPVTTAYRARAHAAVVEALMARPPAPQEARRRAVEVAQTVSTGGGGDGGTSGGGDGGGGMKPNLRVFIGAAVLLVLLLLITVYVATAADAQAAGVTSSQLKDLSSKLITFDFTFAGVVAGLVGGEAIGKKS